MDGTFLFLGTGASSGVPLIGCSCAVCTSSDPRNQRLRPSGLVRCAGRALLIDIGPDFRMQALRYQVSHVDGLLLTHAHYDHVAGIDELRVMNFRQKKAFPCLLSQETYDALRAQHDYLFEEPNPDYYKTAHLNCLILPKSEGQIDFLEIPVSYVSYRQAGMQVNGFRIGNFAYVSDIRDYEETIFDSLLGVETLVLSALKKEPSNVHFGLDEAVAFARKVKAAQTWLTHLSHALDHTTVNRRLPPEVQLAFDGLSFPFKVTTHA